MNKSVGAIALVLSLSGCAHLEQAPLVYSSRTALGVDVSTASSETPGLSMTIGYKQVDAAYVPVAVAKSCSEPSAEACSGDAYRLQLVSGSSQNGNANASRDPEEEAAKLEAEAFEQHFQRSVDAFSLAQQQERGAAQRVDALRTKLEPLTLRNLQFEQRKNALEELKARSASIAEESRAGDEIELSEIQRKIGEIEAIKLSDAEQKSLSDLEEELKIANEELAKASADFSTKTAEMGRRKALLAQKRQAISQLNRLDSYSVFGSFEGKTRAGTNEASVGIGKVFATGVASQNISDGLANMYRTRNITTCYEAVTTKAPVTIDAVSLEKLLERCRTKASGD